MTKLGDYLLSLGGVRRNAGVHDCATFPANWAMICGRNDPMAKWRGLYSTEEDALALADDAGGLEYLFDEGLGARSAHPPQEGDIGVIRIQDHDAGAIYTGTRWAFVSERGIVFSTISDKNVLAVWAVDCG